MVEVGGNWGDELIYLGSKTLLKRLNIDYVVMGFRQFLQTPPADCNVYINGNGNANEWCSGAVYDCIKYALMNYSSTVIQGPLSVSLNEAYQEKRFSECLSQINASDFTIYAREATTYNFLKRLVSLKDKCTISRDFDTAFHLEKKDILNICGTEANSYELYAYRNDNEKKNVHLRKSCTRVTLDPARFANSFEQWLRIHSHASSVITNRTHSCILATILNKPVYFFAGKYHKNQSIWQQDLRKRGVKWLSEEDARYALRQRWYDKMIPSKIHNSYKAGEFLNTVKSVPKK